MKLKLPWIKKLKVDNLLNIESKLDAILQPVEPNPSFLLDLRGQLMGKRKTSLFGLQLPEGRFQTGLLFTGLLMSGVLILVAGVRAVLTILGALGLIQHLSSKEDDSASIQPRSIA